MKIDSPFLFWTDVGPSANRKQRVAVGGAIDAGELFLTVEFLQQRLKPALARHHHIPPLLAE